MDNQKGFTPIVIVLIIVTLLAGGILAWQYLGVPEEEKVVKDETADWKTYRNEEYGFEIKYPPDSFITSETEREDGAFVIRFCPSDYLMSWKGEGSCDCGGLVILPNVKRLSVEEFLEDLYDFYDLKFKEIETKQGIIALEPAWEQNPEYYEKFGLLGSGLEYHYWFVGNPKWIVTVSHTQDCGIEDWGTTPEQLLSTFRFLE
jgi:hypothetical protein